MQNISTFIFIKKLLGLKMARLKFEIKAIYDGKSIKTFWFIY